METKSKFDLFGSLTHLNNIGMAVFFLFLCLVTYQNVFQNEFLMDDYPMLIQNYSIDNTQFLQINPQSLKTQAYFRPVTHVLNFITYAFFGNGPWGYHAFNLALFYLCSIALYSLLKIIIRDQVTVLLTCVLFCVHPINGVLVNYKNATGYAFMLLSFLLSLLCLISGEKNRSNGGQYFLNAVWFFLAPLCHEVVILYFTKEAKFDAILKKCLPSLSIIIIYFAYKMFQGAGHYSFINLIFSFHLSVIEYVASVTKLIVWYVQKLMGAQGILLIFDIPLTERHAWLWASLLVILIFLSIYLMGIKWRKDPKSWALSWMLIGFIPLTLACFSRPNLGFIIEPHWLLFSSLGYFVLLAIGCSKLKEITHPVIWHLCILAICGYYLMQSHQYNYLWGKQERYCRYWLSISPNNFMPNYWLGFAYIEQKEYLKAREVYQRLLKKVNVPFEVYGNLGICELKLGNYHSAIEYLNTAFHLSRGNANIYFYLGEAYFYLGDLTKAESLLKEAFDKDPQLISSLEMLLRIYLKEGREKEAADLYQLMIEKDPLNQEAHLIIDQNR